VSSREKRLDKGTIFGVTLGVGGIVAGLLLEGGNLSQVLQPTAALIVVGGTFGAVLIQFKLGTVISAVSRLTDVVFEPKHDRAALIAQLVRFANKARKHGIVSVDSELKDIQDPFLRKALMLAVDGTDPKELREIMELDIDCSAEAKEEIPKVYESAGGFSPTIGIIGAVLGLIQVMQHLENIDEVGRGIAVAFVATIYGVAAANLFLLPISGKLRTQLQHEQNSQHMTLEGVISILEGMNPRVLETKLGAFIERTSSEPGDSHLWRESENPST
jgi:chemotaxis protein MotA